MCSSQRLHLGKFPWLPPSVAHSLGARVGGVNQTDKETIVRQDVDMRIARRHDETRVLADTDLGKRVGAPDSLAIAQSRAIHPSGQRLGIHIFPGLPGKRVDEEDTVNAADVGLGMFQRLDLRGDARRSVPIIVVPVQDNVAMRFRAGRVALGADRLALLAADVTHLLMLRNQIGNAVVAIVEYDEFLVEEVLRQEHGDRPRHELAPVGGRHDAGNAGHSIPQVAVYGKLRRIHLVFRSSTLSAFLMRSTCVRICEPELRLRLKFSGQTLLSLSGPPSCFSMT